MNEIYSLRQDIYYVIIPLAIPIIAWLLPLLQNNFTRKWKRHKNKSACELYEIYLLTILPLGILFLLFSTVLFSALNLAINDAFGIGLTTKALTIVVAFFSAAFNIIYMLLKKHIKKTTTQLAYLIDKCNKYKCNNNRQHPLYSCQFS